MTCKRSEQCDHADLCRFAKNTDYNLLGGSCFEPKDPQTNEEWLRIATMEELAGAIYEWYSQGHIEGKNKKLLSSVTRVVEWLKQPHIIKE